MGTRAQVWIKETGVFLYQHWDGYELPNIVRTALQKKDRWGDVEYLTHIIFSEMIRENISGSTGFGIGKCQHGDIEYLIEIGDRFVTICKIGFDANETKNVLYAGTFDDFIEQKRTEW